MKALGSVTLMTMLVSRLWDIQPAAATPSDRFFDSDGIRIRYVEEGQGPPVVLIHGYIANADRHWIDTGVLANLARDHRVVALDCRGHGKSDKPIEPQAYGVEMADDIVRLLDHLKIRRAHVVGFSMGAFVAGRLVTTHADRLLSATFVGHHPVRAWTPADHDEAQASARDLESETPFRSLILALSPPDAVPSEEEIRALSQRLVAANNPKALAAYHRGRRALAVTDADLAAVRVPTLAIIGSEDPALSGVQALRTRRVWPLWSCTERRMAASAAC